MEKILLTTITITPPKGEILADLYWIRTREMTDMFSEGYIGISTISAKSRWNAHKASSKLSSKAHLPVYRAFRKYGTDNLVMSVLVQGPDDYILDLEVKLRPEPGIGWNCAMGGQETTKGLKQSPELIERRVSKIRGKTHSDETKKKMSEASKGKPKSPEHRAKCSIANLGKKRSEKVKAEQAKKMRGLKKITEEGRKNLSEHHKNLLPWQRSRSKLDLWANAIDAFEFSKAENFSQRYLAKRYNTKDSSVSKLYEMLKSGWNPSTDERYLCWLSEYKENKG